MLCRVATSARAPNRTATVPHHKLVPFLFFLFFFLLFDVLKKTAQQQGQKQAVEIAITSFRLVLFR